MRAVCVWACTALDLCSIACVRVYAAVFGDFLSVWLGWISKGIMYMCMWYAHGLACEVGCQACWCQIVCVCACARMAVRTHTTARTVDSQFHWHLCLVKIEKQDQKGHCPSEKRCTFHTISLTYVESLTNIREWSFLHANSETHVQSKLNAPPNLPLVGGWYSRSRNTRGCAAEA